MKTSDVWIMSIVGHSNRAKKKTRGKKKKKLLFVAKASIRDAMHKYIPVARSGGESPVVTTEIEHLKNDLIIS